MKSGFCFWVAVGWKGAGWGWGMWVLSSLCCCRPAQVSSLKPCPSHTDCFSSLVWWDVFSSAPSKTQPDFHGQLLDIAGTWTLYCRTSHPAFHFPACGYASFISGEISFWFSSHLGGIPHLKRKTRQDLQMRQDSGAGFPLHMELLCASKWCSMDQEIFSFVLCGDGQIIKKDIVLILVIPI